MENIVAQSHEQHARHFPYTCSTILQFLNAPFSRHYQPILTVEPHVPTQVSIICRPRELHIAPNVLANSNVAQIEITYQAL